MFQNHLISLKKIKSTFNNKYYNIKYSYGVIQFFVIKYELRKKKVSKYSTILWANINIIQ